MKRPYGKRVIIVEIYEFMEERFSKHLNTSLQKERRKLVKEMLDNTSLLERMAKIDDSPEFKGEVDKINDLYIVGGIKAVQSYLEEYTKEFLIRI